VKPMKRRIVWIAFWLLLLGLRVHATEESYIVKFNDSLQTYAATEQGTSRQYTSATYAEVEEYLEMGIVAYYEPDYTISLFEEIVDEVDETPWNLDNIKIEKAWKIGCYGNEVRVGVIDSGCMPHPDLEQNLLEGRNYISTDVTDTADNIGHGTYVSGIIAAEYNDAYMTGVAPQAKIIPLKCFEPDMETTTLMIATAIRDAVDIYECDVINLSLGISESYITTALEEAVKHAIQNGCILVAAVGNKGNATAYYPANYDDVVGVGSVNKYNMRSTFSQKNATVDVVAPGEGISSLAIDGYTETSGTSFATPHVTALAAIAKGIDRRITSQEFDALLAATSTKLEENYCGYGILNAEAIIDELLKEMPAFLSPVTESPTSPRYA